mmetsp:Transcript_17114/g.36231  ORF Transcript_17114/g.36231 Transcript_17114/m.36231 type:complete len:193 (-) Transcript_17114:45-623(-)
MARVGSSDFYQSGLTPVQQCSFWREGINKHYSDHPFHTLHGNVPPRTLKGHKTSSSEGQEKTWNLLRRCDEARTDDAYVDGRQRPRGLETVHTATTCHPMRQVGQDPLSVAKPRCFRSVTASASSGALPMAAKLAVTRGESLPPPTPLHHSTSHLGAGWEWHKHGEPVRAAPLLGASTERHRAPSFTRILNS